MVALLSPSHSGNQISMVPTPVKVFFEFQERVGIYILPKCSFTANINIITEKYSPHLPNSGNFSNKCQYSCYIL